MKYPRCTYIYGAVL